MTRDMLTIGAITIAGLVISMALLPLSLVAGAVAILGMGIAVTVVGVLIVRREMRREREGDNQ